MGIGDRIMLWLEFEMVKMTYKLLLKENKRLKAEHETLTAQVAALEEREQKLRSAVH